MKNFKDICQKFDSAVLQQLYKKITDDNCKIQDKEVFPVALVQSVFDAISGMRLDDILSHYNYIHIQYKGTRESTRLAIPIAHRRKTLIISYIDYDGNNIVEQYIGETINDNDWQKWDNWVTPFTEGSFNVNLPDEKIHEYLKQYFNDNVIQDIINQYLKDLDLSTLVGDKIDNLINNYLDSISNDIENLINQHITGVLDEEKLKELITGIVQDNIKEYLAEYLNSDEGKALIAEVVYPYIDEKIGELREEIAEYLQDNERVIANALIRHEQWIQEHSK